MKKRSQSFLRIKTQQSEDDYDSTQWMGRIDGKKMQGKGEEKIVASMDFDK